MSEFSHNYKNKVEKVNFLNILCKQETSDER
jgi:hypothetical protein